MAGHSHYANIAHKKGIVDAKRGKLFSKLSRYIIIAARNGGGDPDTNLKLRYAIDKARSVSMPRENIERAVKRGTGELAGAVMEELTYEGFGPGNVAIVCELVTDNGNRTLGEVKKIFEKGGGLMGKSGCVGYLFDRVGLITIEASTIEEDTLMGLALDSGASDVQRVGDHFEVTTDVLAFLGVQTALSEANVKWTNAEITMIPKSTTDVDAETGRKVLKLLDTLDEYDDIQSVYSNVTMSDELIAMMSE